MRLKMMFFIGILLSGFIKAEEDSFITKDEYAKMLYKNPRGISCQKCHGERGEGKIIASYMKNGKPKVLQGGPIYHLDYKSFKKALQSAHNVMPRYYLTQKEMAALYYYLQNANRKKESQ